MKVSIILSKNQIITTDTLVDELVVSDELKIYTADNLLMIVKPHNNSEDIGRFLAKENLNIEMIETNLLELKKNASFVAITKENRFVVGGDFNNYNPIYYLEKDEELFVSFYPELIANFTKQKLNRTYFALRIVNFDTVYPFTELTPWDNVKLLNSRKILVALEGQFKQVFPWRNNGENKNIAEVA